MSDNTLVAVDWDAMPPAVRRKVLYLEPAEGVRVHDHQGGKKRTAYLQRWFVQQNGLEELVTDETQAQELRARIAEQVATKGVRKPSKKVWKPPALTDFAHGRVLAFDQTLTKTGFSVVVSDYEGLHITEGNVLRPSDRSDLSSFELTLHKAASLGSQLEALMMMLGGTVDLAIHEMPSVHGYRVESSLMAAREVRRAAGLARVKVAMVQNQSMRALLNPPEERGPKKYVKSAIESLIPQDRRHAKSWNQDVADSVGLALTYFHQQHLWGTSE